MEANFKISAIKYKKIAPYKLKGLSIYSIEEAIYLFYNNWQEFNDVFFGDNFINWVKEEILDADLGKKLDKIKSYDSFYQKSSEFLKINNFYTESEIKKTLEELSDWEKKGKIGQFKALGDRFFEEYLFENAIEQYLNEIKIQGETDILYNNIGICYIRIKEFDKAFGYLKKAFQLGNGENLDILYNLIEVCILIDNEDEFSHYIKLVKEDMYCYYLAEYDCFKGNYKSALENYEKAYEIKKDYLIVIKIAEVFIKLSNYKNALKVMEFLGEENLDVLIKKSEICEKMKNYSVAIKYLERAVFYEKNNYKIWLKLAKLYRLEYEFIKAEGAILKAKILTENEKILLEYALIKKAQGKFKEYQNIIRKIILMNCERYRKRILIENKSIIT